MVSSQLAGIESLAVRTANPWVPRVLEAALVDRLSRCGQHITAVAPGQADLTVEWHASEHAICLDYWSPECESQAVRAELLFADGTRAERSRRRPGWCQVRECLVELFSDDLAHFVCDAQQPDTLPVAAPDTAPHAAPVISQDVRCSGASQLARRRRSSYFSLLAAGTVTTDS